MDNDAIVALIITTLGLGIVIFFAWERHRMCVAFIEGDLLRHRRVGAFDAPQLFSGN